MMSSVSNLLFVISSALLASGYVVERGYIPPVGVNYCQDLVSHLNARYNAGIQSERCPIDILRASNEDAELLDPAELRCDELIRKVQDQGIRTDTGICPIEERVERGEGENFLTGDVDRGEYEQHCRRVVERLRFFKAKVAPEVCRRVTRGNDQTSWDGVGSEELRRVDYSKLSCGKLVRLARKMEIPVSSVICQSHDSPSDIDNHRDDHDNELSFLDIDEHDNRGSSDGDAEEYRTCPGIIARLRVLGIRVDADVCVGLDVSRKYTQDEIGRMRCEDVVTYARTLRILGENEGVCSGRVLRSRHGLFRREEVNTNSGCDVVKNLLLLEGIVDNSYVCTEDESLIDSIKLSRTGDQEYCDRIKDLVSKQDLQVQTIKCLGKPLIII